MVLKQTYKTVTLLAVVLIAPLAVLSLSGQVLCVGEGNHMQVESTGGSCCDFGSPDTGESKLEKNISEYLGCGVCSDVELSHIGSTRISYRAFSQTKSVTIEDFVSPVIVRLSANLISRQMFLNEYTPSSTQPTLSISSIVFIC